MNFLLAQGELSGRVSPVQLYDTWVLAGGDRESTRVGTGIDWILTTDGTRQDIDVTDASVVGTPRKPRTIFRSPRRCSRMEGVVSDSKAPPGVGASSSEPVLTAVALPGNGTALGLVASGNVADQVFEDRATPGRV